MRLWLYYMLEAIWLYSKNMQNLENLDVFKILFTQKLLRCPKDPFVRSALNNMYFFLRDIVGNFCWWAEDDSSIAGSLYLSSP